MKSSSDTPSLEEAVAAARRGELWAQDYLVDELRHLAKIVCTRGNSPELGDLNWEEVSEEASERLFQTGLHRFPSSRSARAHLYSILKVVLLHKMRTGPRRALRHRAHKEMASKVAELVSESATSPDPNSSSSPASVQQMLDGADTDSRELITALILTDATYKDVADETGFAESSIRSKLSRCLRRLREKAN